MTAPALGLAWRFAALGGLTVGLAAAPLARSAEPGGPIALGVAAGLALTALRPRHHAATGPHAATRIAARSPAVARGAAAAWLALIALAAAAIGVGVGTTRLASIERGALDLRAGTPIAVRGFLTAVPRRADGQVRLRIETPGGRLLVEAPEPLGELRVGREIHARGTIRDPSDWERDYLERLGIRDVLVAAGVRPTGRRRGGLSGELDVLRDRAGAALGRGTNDAASNLLRGFVLGQDDLIDAPTVDEFKRSGLAHLLAVSGQNVMLLAVLAGAVLAVVGTSRRTRLVGIIALIAVYVPVAGAGPSIQRAGVMGAAGVVAALASRPRSRWYALLLAAAATLAINPLASGDVGWQLSFAAVVGILLASDPIARLIDRHAPRSPFRTALAAGLALTVAATLATAPLMAHHFGAVSVTALPANLVALPAVAPVMWLGMLAAAFGQAPWLPVEPVTALAGVLAGYIAQVAEWFAAPAWAQLDIALAGGSALAAVYAVLAVATTLALRSLGRRGALRPRRPARVPRRRGVAIAAAVAVLAAAAIVVAAGPAGRAGPEPGLRITVLDVGQGDAILLAPRDGPPLLVDAGPPEAGIAASLDRRGIESLAALVVTHPQRDHVGGATDVLANLDVDRLVHAGTSRELSAAAAAAGVDAVGVAAGSRLRAGSLRLEVLWPPPELLLAPRPQAAVSATSDPNRLSLVLLVRWRGFEALLTGDAEAEATRIDPGEVDLLKVAHHGSADAGLDALLARTSPEFAVISVGADNPYGHPAPETLAELASARVPTLRTDHDGEITIDISGGRWRVR